jgi:hypothetical protein
MIVDGVAAIIYLVLGLAAIIKTHWVVRQTLRIRKRYPKAFVYLADPWFIRVYGFLLLLFAGDHALRLLLRPRA